MANSGATSALPLAVSRAHALYSRSPSLSNSPLSRGHWPWELSFLPSSLLSILVVLLARWQIGVGVEVPHGTTLEKAMTIQAKVMVKAKTKDINNRINRTIPANQGVAVTLISNRSHGHAQQIHSHGIRVGKMIGTTKVSGVNRLLREHQKESSRHNL